MKSLFLIFMITIVSTAASAQNGLNSSAKALACMKKYGFTYEEWRADAVPASKADPYRRCRDAK